MFVWTSCIPVKVRRYLGIDVSFHGASPDLCDADAKGLQLHAEGLAKAVQCCLGALKEWSGASR